MAIIVINIIIIHPFDRQTLKAAEAKKPDNTKTEYILAAIICVLVVAFLITLYIMLNNIRR